ncbi:STAS domain-containing protein [Polyangium aurulentum]|uniref:STAS domain-containing protein n=1 Tax=Polyangium aurulentum TaxID=2567896 RepID=UPI0010AED832|nr:STAS domain-containing protein [Polyangium aurulentum]UQA55804.1 STAS domain-containing protein [Polyangium aurulentum]
MEHTAPGQNVDERTRTIEALERENAELRRRVAELEVPARRFQALFDGGIVSVQILDAAGRVVEVNRRWEQLWGVRLEDLAGWSVRTDSQLAANGFLPLVERAFAQGEATALPTLRFDPVKAEPVHKGIARWVATSLHPIKDAAGNVCEVFQIHVDVGEIKQSEDELRLETERLEAAVAERTAELEEHLRMSKEQQRAIAALSTPVLRLWKGILALPLIGRIDADRAARILDVLLQSIVEMRAEHVILDVTGVPFVDAEGARHLRDTVRAASLLGAQCIIVGVSSTMAQTLVDNDLGLEDVPTFATLQDGLRRFMSRRSDGR